MPFWLPLWKHIIVTIYLIWNIKIQISKNVIKRVKFRTSFNVLTKALYCLDEKSNSLVMDLMINSAKRKIWVIFGYSCKNVVQENYWKLLAFPHLMKFVQGSWWTFNGNVISHAHKTVCERSGHGPMLKNVCSTLRVFRVLLKCKLENSS